MYLEKLFARWGILESIRPRIVVPPPGVPVGSLVAGGQAALGFQQLSELLNVAGIEVLAPCRRHSDHHDLFSRDQRALRAAASGRSAAGYMRLPSATALKQRYGMEPA
ncbi:MAG: substrate-binding domain-containing protein [Steroidobacteraceae bacterium]